MAVSHDRGRYIGLSGILGKYNFKSIGLGFDPEPKFNKHVTLIVVKYGKLNRDDVFSYFARPLDDGRLTEDSWLPVPQELTDELRAAGHDVHRHFWVRDGRNPYTNRRALS